MSLRHRHVLGLPLLPPPSTPSVQHLCLLLELRTRELFYQPTPPQERLGVRVRRVP